jgi:ADP-heptose:LPS heptosyltransferase
VGQAHEFGGAVLTHQVVPLPEPSHQTDRNLHLLEAVGLRVDRRDLTVRISPATREAGRGLLRGVGIDPDSPFVVLAPGASCSTRRYPAARFREVAEDLAAQTGLAMVVVGSAREADLLAAVTRDTRVVRSLVGQTTVAELAAVIGSSHLLITSHSLPVHLGDALRVPTLVLFSGTDEEAQWAPRRTRSILLRVPTDCAPCRLFGCPYHLECLDIPPAAVVEAALELLSPISTPRPTEGAWVACAS